MATVSQEVCDYPGGSVTLSWDDVTLIYSQIAWLVSAGTLQLKMSQPGKITSVSADLVTDGSKNLSVLGLTTAGATFNLSWVP